MLNTIEEVLAELRAGRPVLVTDDADRENEGDAILAAELADPRWVGWMVRHTSGYLCAPMTEERADQLDLPLMWPASQDPLRTRYTVAVDAAHGITTGIDAVQRARTARVLADPSSTPSDLVRPGHVLPLRARAGGVLERRGHTEAAVDLARLAGLEPVGLIGELVGDDGMCLRADAIADLARTEGLALTTIDQLAQWRQAHDPGPAVPTQRVTALASAHLPTRHGQFAITGYRDNCTGVEHVLLVGEKGIDADDGGPAWVRCTRNVSPGTPWGRCAVTVATSWRPPSSTSAAMVGQSSCCVTMRDVLPAYSTKLRPTKPRMAVWTPSTLRPTSVCPSMPASTGQPSQSWRILGLRASGYLQTTRLKLRRCAMGDLR